MAGPPASCASAEISAAAALLLPAIGIITWMTSLIAATCLPDAVPVSRIALIISSADLNVSWKSDCSCRDASVTFRDMVTAAPPSPVICAPAAPASLLKRIRVFANEMNVEIGADTMRVNVSYAVFSFWMFVSCSLPATVSALMSAPSCVAPCPMFA